MTPDHKAQEKLAESMMMEAMAKTDKDREAFDATMKALAFARSTGGDVSELRARMVAEHSAWTSSRISALEVTVAYLCFVVGRLDGSNP